MFESILLSIAIYHQKKAIKYCKSLRQEYLNKNQKELASCMVDVLVEQEKSLIYLQTEREQLKYDKKKKEN